MFIDRELGETVRFGKIALPELSGKVCRVFIVLTFTSVVVAIATVVSAKSASTERTQCKPGSTSLSPGQQLLPTTCRRRSVDTAGPRTTVGARPFRWLWPAAARADGNALLPVQPGPSGQCLQPPVVAPHKHQKGHRERIDGWAPMAAGTSIATDHEFDLKCHVGLA